MHDNLLSNLTSSALNQRFGNTSQAHLNHPTLLAQYSAEIDDANPALLTRPGYSGNQGAVNNALPYDQANGLLPMASGQFVATDTEGDTVHFSGEIVGTSYGTFTVDDDGTWSFVLDNRCCG